MKLLTAKILSFLCFFLLITIWEIQATLSKEECKEDICSICIQEFKPEDLADKELGKKTAFHFKSNREKTFPELTQQYHFFHKVCLKKWKNSISNPNKNLCPLCRQPKIIFTPEDKLLFFCRADRIQKRIAKELSLVVSQVGKEVFEACFAECCSKSKWDRVYKIYQKTEDVEKKQIIIQLALEHIETASCEEAFKIVFWKNCNFLEIFKEHSVFDRMFAAILDKLDSNCGQSVGDAEMLASFFVAKIEHRNALLEYFNQAERGEKKEIHQEKITFILLEYFSKKINELQSATQNPLKTLTILWKIMPVLSIILTLETNRRLKIDHLIREKISQSRMQILNSISIIQNSNLISKSDYSAFYEFKAHLEILSSSDLFEKMLSLKDYILIPIESLVVVAYHVEDEYLSLFTDTARYSRLEFEELEKISSKYWYKYLFREIVDFFSQDFVIATTGGIKNLAINGSICEISLVEPFFEMLKKNLENSSLENLILWQLDNYFEVERLFEIIEQAKIKGGLKNLKLNDLFLNASNLNSLVQLLERSSKTLVSLEMSRVHQRKVGFEFSVKPIKLENLKKICMQSCGSLIYQSIHFKLHSNYEIISLDYGYFNFFNKNEHEYFTLKPFNNICDFKKLLRFLESNKELITVQLYHLFHFEQQNQKMLVKNTLKSLPKLKSLLLLSLLNFNDYISNDFHSIENLVIDHLDYDFDGNWQPLQALKGLKTLCIRHDFKLNRSFFDFIKNSSIEKLTLNEKCCAKVQQQLNQLPNTCKRTITIVNAELDEYAAILN